MAYDHRKQAHEWGYRDGRDGLPKTRNAGFSREFVKAYNQGDVSSQNGRPPSPRPTPR